MTEEPEIVERSSGYWIVDNGPLIDGPFIELSEASEQLEKLLEIRRDAAYVKNPNFCPFCRSDEIEHHLGVFTNWFIDATKLETFENEENRCMVFQRVRCDTCETEWHDIYELTGYEEVIAGRE